LANLTVGAGQQYSTVAAAIAASRDGDVLQVQAGTYVNDFAEINTRITLQAVGGRAKLLATESPPNGKAILTTNVDVTIQGFEFTGAEVPDLNGAGIRHQSGNLTVLDSWFHHNQMGILTNGDPNATLTIRNSEFDHNLATGASPADGLTHNLYVNDIARLIIEDSYFHDAAIGHQIKSRAAETIITGSRIVDLDSTSSYSIDLPNGGRVLLAGNVIQQGPNGGNPVIVAFGSEGGLYPGSSIEMRDNTVLNDMAGGTLLWNAAGAPATLSGTTVFGLGAGSLVSGPAAVSATSFLSSKPALDFSAPWAGVGTPNTPGTPGTPNTPGMPSTPGTPSSPDTPSVPNTPGTPNTPDTPSTPDTPDMPGTPGTPSTSDTPGQTLTGSDEPDTLVGGTADDTISGSGGRDTLTGSVGEDHFVWEGLHDRVDRVTDFNAAEGDVLDLSDLFGDGEHPHDQADLLSSGFVQMTETSAGVLVGVDPDGGGDRFLRVTWLEGTTIAGLGDHALIA
jgi:hypothetical protein